MSETIEIVQHVVTLLSDKKAKNIRVYSLEKVSDFTSYLVIASGGVSRHVRALTNEVYVHLKENKTMPLGWEGFPECRWVILDYVDFIVHIFDEETRDFYQLDKIWKEHQIFALQN